jgi:hypothetical protein
MSVSPEPASPPQAITAAALALKDGHARFGVRLNANDRRALAAEVLEAARPYLRERRMTAVPPRLARPVTRLWRWWHRDPPPWWPGLISTGVPPPVPNLGPVHDAETGLPVPADYQDGAS